MSTPSRNGFTLLESVAAVALCAVILATVYRSLDIASQQRRSGRAQVQLDAELIGLLRVIETAIRDARHESIPPDFDSAWSPKKRERSPANAVSPNRPLAAVFGPAWETRPWLVGSKHSVLLLTPDSHRAGEAESLGVHTATLLSGEGVGLSELPPRWQQAVRDPLTSTDDRSYLMLRKLRAATSIDPRDRAGLPSLSPATLPAEISPSLNAAWEALPWESFPWEVFKRVPMSRAIIGLRFRYSDGATWHESWPTTSLRPLHAVEVTLTGGSGGIERTQRLLIAGDSIGVQP